jgi:cytochrome oxidase Cu insertion factor (SCO1/SenC/PrrC family)
MHQELAKDGLVVISLSVDDADEKAAALKFLQDQKATFQNFILEDKDRNEKAGDEKLYHSAPPIVHVFDREGKVVKTLEGKKEAEGLEKLVKELLQKK